MYRLLRLFGGQGHFLKIRLEIEMKIFDTIAAISTPKGKGGVAMIRISGSEALYIADKVFSPKNKKKLSDALSNTAVYGDIFMIGADGSEKEKIDDGIATLYRCPHSFTGEDTVEICCHGGVLVTESVLLSCLAAGCRQALPGEFTKRAFVSGKLSLSQAEGLGNLLQAQTYNQLLLSRGGMGGALSGEIQKNYDRITAILASIYAKIDFPDEDLSSLSIEEMKEQLEEILANLKKLSDTYKTGRVVLEGIKTVICGRTNAGKSTLYNQLVGRDAAIVTSIEGTTRDILEQTVSFGGATLRLCDTAGLRKTDDEIENIGIERTNKALLEAELVLAVFDIQRPLDKEQDIALIEKLKNHKGSVIAILNKCEKESGKSRNYDTASKIRSSFGTCVEISAATGEGLEALSDVISKMYIDSSLDLSSDAVVSNERQYGAILGAIDKVSGALSSICTCAALDATCTVLEEAMSKLGELDGREVTEDIVSHIFSHFCVGK